MENIALLISGGVDSAVALYTLVAQGYKPHLFYIKIGADEEGLFTCTAEEDIEMATLMARKYGLKLDVIDLHQEYWDNVVRYLIDKVKTGFTPNPDVMCNKLIKFGCFEEQIGHEFDLTATGHYATTVMHEGKKWLATAKDPLKDQTDFLCQIEPWQMKKLVFPVGHLLKSEIRSIAEEQNLPCAKRKDSQGICFLGNTNYNELVKHYLGEREGAIVEKETGKVLGRHRGYWFHTLGQRKGLGLSGGPFYVIEKDITTNTIFVSKGYQTPLQYGQDFKLGGMHFITENPWEGLEQKVCIDLKIRHTPEFTTAWLEKEGEKYAIHAEEPLQGISPGQYGVIYQPIADGRKICIGSGEITA